MTENIEAEKNNSKQQKTAEDDQEAQNLPLPSETNSEGEVTACGIKVQEEDSEEWQDY